MKFLTKIFFLLIPLFSHAQATFIGILVDTKDQPIAEAIITWKGSDIVINSNAEGIFEIARALGKDTLIIQAAGYRSIKMYIPASEKKLMIEMVTSIDLSTVEINGKRVNQNISNLDIRNIEYVTSSELQKAPCCNLSESFENSGTVDVSYTDAITGAKEIQMLGLKGIYSQLMIENRPTLYGLTASYALEYLPGTWLSSIQIVKGTGSIINGFNAISGQINAELKKPNEDDRLFLNLFAETSGRAEVNLHLNTKINQKWSHGLLLHTDYFDKESDHDGNTFVDMPLKKQINALYRSFYTGDKFSGQFNIQLVNEKRNGGQLSSLALSNPYLINVNAKRTEAWAKVGYHGFVEPYRQLGSQFGFTNQELNVLVGTNRFVATQNSQYANIMYATIFNTSEHKISYGINFQRDEYIEKFNDNPLDRTDQTMGLYSEYNYQHPVWGSDLIDWNIVMGMRYDRHNRFGNLWTPRFHVKYNWSENTSIRASVGRGYRTANVISENIGLLATGRTIIIQPNLDIERAWNTGLSFTKKFQLLNRSNMISADFYYTNFDQQIIADQDQSSSSITFKNLEGKSYAASLFFIWNFELLEGLNFKTAYKINKSQTTLGGKLLEVPLIPFNRALENISWESPNNHWLINATTQWIGASRLIVRHDLPAELHSHQSANSPSYFLQSIQFTYKTKTIDFYMGSENLFGYVQHMPILSYNEPFSTNFEATQIYAPTMGARVYTGVRYAIK